jgi:hypothetical protein
MKIILPGVGIYDRNDKLPLHTYIFFINILTLQHKNTKQFLKKENGRILTGGVDERTIIESVKYMGLLLPLQIHSFR